MRKLRKNYQRKFNKIIRECNKALVKDELILGRFYMKQIAAEFREFDDKSGGILFTIIRCYDKKTKQFKDFPYDYSPWRNYKWHLNMEILNTFIVDDIGACIIREEVIDFRKVSVPNQNVRKGEYSFFTLEKY